MSGQAKTAGHPSCTEWRRLCTKDCPCGWGWHGSQEGHTPPGLIFLFTNEEEMAGGKVRPLNKVTVLRAGRLSLIVVLGQTRF